MCQKRKSIMAPLWYLRKFKKNFGQYSILRTTNVIIWNGSTLYYKKDNQKLKHCENQEMLNCFDYCFVFSFHKTSAE